MLISATVNELYQFGNDQHENSRKLPGCHLKDSITTVKTNIYFDPGLITSLAIAVSTPQRSLYAISFKGLDVKLRIMETFIVQRD